MDGQSPGLDFALIGHQDTWAKVSDFLHAIRSTELERLSVEKIRDIFPWIPPRKVFHIFAKSTFDGRQVKGAYLESFIPPDQLHGAFFKNILQKVQQAGECAMRERAKVVTLGGFTSIVLEGDMGLLPEGQGTAFTTGNTLTSAFIVKGLEKAAAMHGLSLPESNLLVIGSTGDIGTACVRYFAGKVRKLLLCARQEPQLKRQCKELREAGIEADFSCDLASLLPQADVVISVASTPEPQFSVEQCRPHALICDAGYPKNIVAGHDGGANRLWHGGMGQLLGGYFFDPDYSEAFYHYPAPDTGHGCLLESILLAMEGRFEAYSTGRGKINAEKIEEIWRIAQKHGFAVAPFFNQTGVWDHQKTTQQ